MGELDFILPTNGSLLAMQNVTWGGVKGFQRRPNYNTFFVPNHPEYNGGALSASGDVGTWGYERGVTFYSVQLGGHGMSLSPFFFLQGCYFVSLWGLTWSLTELPGYAPGAGYRVVEAMLGRIPDLGVVGDFTTQTGDYGNYANLTGSTRRPSRSKKLYGAAKVFRHESVWGPA